MQRSPVSYGRATSVGVVTAVEVEVFTGGGAAGGMTVGGFSLGLRGSSSVGAVSGVST